MENLTKFPENSNPEFENQLQKQILLMQNHFANGFNLVNENYI